MKEFRIFCVQGRRYRSLMNARSCCTNCCTIASQNTPKRTRTTLNHIIFHNNIRKVGSFRNRQVTSSTLVVGSIFQGLLLLLTARSIQRQVPDKRK